MYDIPVKMEVLGYEKLKLVELDFVELFRDVFDSNVRLRHKPNRTRRATLHHSEDTGRYDRCFAGPRGTLN